MNILNSTTCIDKYLYCQSTSHQLQFYGDFSSLPAPGCVICPHSAGLCMTQLGHCLSQKAYAFLPDPTG